MNPKWNSITQLARRTQGVITASGIKTAATEGRVTAIHDGPGGKWLVDTTDPTVMEWLEQAQRIQDRTPTPEELRAENEELKTRLKEKEDKLEAVLEELTETRAETLRLIDWYARRLTVRDATKPHSRLMPPVSPKQARRRK